MGPSRSRRKEPQLTPCVPLSEFFSIQDTFPIGNCMVRNKNGTPLRSIYVCNNLMKAIVRHNDVARLRMISAGIRIFLRQDSNNKLELQCKWRIPAEGVQSLVGHVDPARIDDAGLGELRVFLENSYPMVRNKGREKPSATDAMTFSPTNSAKPSGSKSKCDLSVATSCALQRERAPAGHFSSLCSCPFGSRPTRTRSWQTRRRRGGCIEADVSDIQRILNHLPRTACSRSGHSARTFASLPRRARLASRTLRETPLLLLRRSRMLRKLCLSLRQ